MPPVFPTPAEMELADVRREVADLRMDISELRCEIAGLVEAWRTANGVVKFVKWLAGLAAAFAVIASACAAGKIMLLDDIRQALK